MPWRVRRRYSKERERGFSVGNKAGHLVWPPNERLSEFGALTSPREPTVQFENKRPNPERIGYSPLAVAYSCGVALCGRQVVSKALEWTEWRSVKEPLRRGGGGRIEECLDSKGEENEEVRLLFGSVTLQITKGQWPSSQQAFLTSHSR